MSRIAVIGTGYVGLTTGAYLAHIGHEVVCADVVEEKVAGLSRGEVPIFEVGLEDLVRAGLESGLLRFVVGGDAAVEGAEFVFLCLPTPQGVGGAADLSFIEAEAAHLGPLLGPGTVVINKSTVPVGSTRRVERGLGRGDVFVVSNPEFLREGSAVHDCLNPDRIVIGADSTEAATRVAGLYERIHAPVLVTDPSSAELIKYASNAFLATKISYINAIANLCEVVGADVKEVVLGMGYDKRIGFEFLRPGPGWGGSCFDPEETLLVRRGEEIRLLSFEELFGEVERYGAEGWEALSFLEDEPRPLFLPIGAFTCRPWTGELVSIRTKMGRRVRVTSDHPILACDGRDATTSIRKRADDLTVNDWVPIAQGFPLTDDLGAPQISTVEVLRSLDVDSGAVRVLAAPTDGRSRALGTLEEVLGLNASLDGLWLSTHPRAHPVPTYLDLDAAFWRIVGLYLAEGCRNLREGSLIWSFHRTKEPELVQEVVDYWARYGVRTSVYDTPTACTVYLRSRLIGTLFSRTLGLGSNSNDHALPDLIWRQPESSKRILLSALWDGDGSWSKVAGGPSVVFEYGTSSRRLADGMLRLLGDLGVVARLKVGRTAKSTRDNYWLVVAGADQVEKYDWLFPSAEAATIRRQISSQAKRIAPTGSGRLSKSAVWARITGLTREPYSGPVYSVEVPRSHTVVASGGLVCSNCFPKDTKALVKIAQDAGYDFGLLEGVIEVNVEQYERMARKVQSACRDGILDGRTIAVWGLTFKAMTDDLRDSPSLEVIRRLRAAGATVRAFDPLVDAARAASDSRLEGIVICTDPYDACTGAVLVTLLTEWDEFRWLDFDKVRDLLDEPVIVDCRNLLDPAAVRKRGFAYHGVGRE